MSSLYMRPCRRLRSEILPLASVGFVSAAVAGLFPREAFVAPQTAADRADATAAEAGCAFVTLSAAQEAAALAAARTSWQGRASRSRVEMLPQELPACAYEPVLGPGACPCEPVAFRAGPQVGTLPPTVAAPAPVRLPKAAAEKPSPTFPRAELLKLKEGL